MKDWKTLCIKILFPPAWMIIILTVISTISLVAVFVNGWELRCLPSLGLIHHQRKREY